MIHAIYPQSRKTPKPNSISFCHPGTKLLRSIQRFRWSKFFPEIGSSPIRKQRLTVRLKTCATATLLGSKKLPLDSSGPSLTSLVSNTENSTKSSLPLESGTQHQSNSCVPVISRIGVSTAVEKNGLASTLRFHRPDVSQLSAVAMNQFRRLATCFVLEHRIGP